MTFTLILIIACLCLTLPTKRCFAASKALAVWQGTDFSGGAAEVFGDTHGEEVNVNYVYAASTGDRSKMAIKFDLPSVPTTPLYLYLHACDDDAQAACSIKITLNNSIVFEGASGFPNDVFEVKQYRIPSGCLTTSQNSLVISNTSSEGTLGNVPWFMVARCAIAPDGYVFTEDRSRDFYVTLPKNRAAMPTPLPVGKKPGFNYRGLKGWLWKTDQYVDIIPFMTKFKLNFLMNCYGSMCDIEHYSWGDPSVNRWYEPLGSDKRKAFEHIVELCQMENIDFCFSMNPNLCSSRPLKYHDPADVEALWSHYSWMQSRGVQWFNISLDDITNGIDPVGQCLVVNEIYSRLLKNDRSVHMIFCPTIYWGDGSSASDAKYLSEVKRLLHPAIYIFWTGDSVVGQITTSAAKRFREAVGHKLFLWDNYPVNDGQPTMHLGPVINRDADLCCVVDGYMANPMHTQSDSNRIPLLTAADYAYNPTDYDPIRSIGQAIVNLEPNSDRQHILQKLVEHYPGFIIWQKGNTGFNPVRFQLNRILSQGHSRYLAEALLNDTEQLVRQLERAYPKKYKAECKIIRDDIKYMRQRIDAHYQNS